MNFFYATQPTGNRRAAKLARMFALALGIITILIFTSIHVTNAGADNGTSIMGPQTPVPPTYFSMNILFYPGKDVGWPAVPFYGFRAWHALWFDLEPQKGQWKWDHLDQLVANAQQHNSELMLILSYSPPWASAKPDQPGDWKNGTVGPVRDMNDWRDYVRAVGTRYKGKIHVYEMWNEPDRPRAWQGDMDSMVQMVKEGSQILKQIDPTVTIVSPSATHPRGPGWLDQFLAKGGANYVDVIGFHFYTGNNGTMTPPETVVPLIQNVKSLMAKYNVNKPLWNTEAGWLGPDFFSDEQQSAYVARAVVLNWVSGVSRYYWYAWDSHKGSQIEMVAADSYTPNPAGKAFATIQQWIGGSVVKRCLTSDNHNYVCEVVNNDNWKFIVWNTDGERDFQLAKNWKVTQITKLDGTVEKIQGDSIHIGIRPVLVQ
jgi:hypothetical protein